MSRGGWFSLGILALVGVLAVAVLVAAGQGTGGASTLARGAEGWMLARLYLEQRDGVAPVVWDRSLDDLPPEARALVLTLPGSGILASDDREALSRFLRRGGTVVVAYSGGPRLRGEELALEALDLGPQPSRSEPPLGFRAWRQYRATVWPLEPGAAWRDTFEGSPPALTAIDWAPTPPRGAQVWFTGGEKSLPLVFSSRRFGGTLWVVPARLFANGQLPREGNGDFLETLATAIPGPWYFDEFHHGLLAADEEVAGITRHLFDLLLLHLALLYALVVWRLLRRFGPPWRPAPRIASSNASFLQGLGALHHRFGHHRRAAALLLERARQLDPRMALPKALDQQAASADASTFRGLAATVATYQRPSTHNERKP